ncbi:6241_t:CDS:10 [Ambispora leptoticha]|uniref:assimilatory sulfite reductase (NADPH) n=1 Tax=Ambispora leptoticha TaxID=144679 RepID=A0A9N8V679_9GLOM|nr:6241_t:CDS:10 [Ambispora leptoticha]
MTTLYSSLIVGWRLQGRHVLIVGGNQVAANRFEFALSANPAKITLVYPKHKINCSKLLEYIEKNSDGSVNNDKVAEANNLLVEFIDKEFEIGMLDNAPTIVDLILSATNDPQLSQTIAIAARERRIPINVAEIPQLCDFLFMPTYRDNYLQVAISTNLKNTNIGGKKSDHALVARKIRDHVMKSIPKQKDIIAASNNLALLRKNRDDGINVPFLSKIIDTLPLGQLAQLSAEAIAALTTEDSASVVLNNILDTIGDESSSTSSFNDEKTSDATIVNELQSEDSYTDDECKLLIRSKIHDRILSIERSGGDQLVDGKAALEYVVYALSTHTFVYPNVRVGYIGSLTENWSTNNMQNIFGNVGRVERMQTRIGAATAILGAAMTFTESSALSPNWQFSAFSNSQAIVNMIPNLYTIALQNIPLVIHVAAQGHDQEMNNIDNYHDVLDARETGVSIINSFSVQELHDIALIAHLASSLTQSPFLHIFDGIKTAHEVTRASLLSYDDIAKLAKEINAEANSFDHHFNSRIDAIELVFNKVGKLLGRHYRLFEYVGAHDAESVFVVLGGETGYVRETVKHLSQYGGKVGAVIVRVYRPWSIDHFLSSLPKTTKRIAVFEHVLNTNSGAGRNNSTLFNDISKIKLALHQLTSGEIINLNADLVDIPPSPNNLKHCVFWDAESHGTVHTTAHIANIFTGIPQLNFSSLSTYDVFNNGGVVTTRLRFGSDPISGTYDEFGADYIAIHDASLVTKYNILHAAKEHTVVLLNSGWDVAELETKLPNDFKYEAARRNIQLYLIDANKIVQDIGLSSSSTSTDATNIVFQTAFLRLYRNTKLDETLQEAIANYYEGVNEKEVTRIVRTIVEQTENSLIRIDIPSLSTIWSQLEKSDQNLPLAIINNSFAPNIDKPSERETKLENWHKVALNLLFKEAHSQEQKVRPDLSEKTFVVKVAENRRLTPLTYDRYLFHIEFDIDENDKFTYNIGEALGVYGHNDLDEVNQFLEFYGLEPNDIVYVPDKDGNRYETRTILQVFTQVLDIFGRPPKRFYESLAKYAKNESEKNKLLWIASSDGLEEFKRRVEETTTYADIFYEFQSARPPAQDLVHLITPIKPRHYSIASSNKVHPNQVHLLIVTVEWTKSNGKKRYGQCTRYLSKLKVGEKVVVSIKSSVMKLPPIDTQPIIMAGLGTGMAPFRAFIEERAYQKSQGVEVGPIILYFGSRNRSMEYLYGEELEAYHAEGVLTHLRLAFSRDQPQKVYIQHKMQEDAVLLHDYLLKQEGWFYLCGPTWPVPDVRDAITDSFVKAGQLSAREANDWVNRLKDLERYILEVDFENVLRQFHYNNRRSNVEISIEESLKILVAKFKDLLLSSDDDNSDAVDTSSTTNYTTSKAQILHLLLFKAWGGQQQWEGQSCVDLIKTKEKGSLVYLDTDLYLRLVERLNLQGYLVETLYSIGAQPAISISKYFIQRRPESMSYLHHPILLISNAISKNQRISVLGYLGEFWGKWYYLIPVNHRLEIVRSTARYMEDQLEQSSPVSPSHIFLNEKTEEQQQHSKTLENVYINEMVSSPLYLLSMDHQQHNTITTRINRRIDFDSEDDSESILHDLLPKAEFSQEKDNSSIILLLMSNFNVIAFKAWDENKNNAQSSNVVKENNNDNTRDWINPLTVSKSARKEKIKKRYGQIKAPEPTSTPNPKKQKNQQLKHELAFIQIFNHIYKQASEDDGINPSFSRILQNSIDCPPLPTTSTTREYTKEELTACRNWIIQCIRLRWPGYVSFFELLLQFVDLKKEFHAIIEFKDLIIHHGLQLELYKSIKKLARIYTTNPAMLELNIMTDSVTLFMAVFSSLSVHARLIFRDLVFNDRPLELEITEPTFNSWIIWPFEFTKRLTSVCNQIISAIVNVSSSSIATGEMEEELGLLNITKSIQSGIIDSLIELSLISPYHVLEKLVQEAIRNKGQARVILKILRKLGSLCWLRKEKLVESPSSLTIKSPFTSSTLIIIVDVTSNLLDQFREQEQKNYLEFVYYGVLLTDNGDNKSPIELKLTEIGESGKKLIDIREYLVECVIPFLKSPSTLPLQEDETIDPLHHRHNITLDLSIAILQKWFQSMTISASPQTSQKPSWLLHERPFHLLLKLVLFLNLKRYCAKYRLTIKQIDEIYGIVKSVVDVIVRFGIRDDDNMIRLNSEDAHQFYKEYKDLDWTIKLLLRPFIQFCIDVFGFGFDNKNNITLPSPVSLPSSLISFCEFSNKDEDVKYIAIGDEEEKEESQTSMVKRIKQMTMFLEACCISDEWLSLFCSSLNKSSHIPRTELRDLFLRIGPYAFCTVLSTCVEEESQRLLTTFLKELISYGMMSVNELLGLGGSDIRSRNIGGDQSLDFFESKVVESLNVAERIQLACLRFTTLNVLSCLSKLYSAKSSQKSPLQEHGISDVWILQNIIKAIKTLVPPTSSLNYLALAFTSIVYGLENLANASLSKSEEILYICLLGVVEMVAEKLQQEKQEQILKKDESVINNNIMIQEQEQKEQLQKCRHSLIHEAISRVKQENGWRNTVIAVEINLEKRLMRTINHSNSASNLLFW